MLMIRKIIPVVNTNLSIKILISLHHGKSRVFLVDIITATNFNIIVRIFSSNVAMELYSEKSY